MTCLVDAKAKCGRARCQGDSRQGTFDEEPVFSQISQGIQWDHRSFQGDFNSVKSTLFEQAAILLRIEPLHSHCFRSTREQHFWVLSTQPAHSAAYPQVREAFCLFGISTGEEGTITGKDTARGENS